MAIAKRQQSNSILITLIAFVIFFIIATTAAVIFYVKFEDRRAESDNLKSDLEKLINAEESQRGIEQIVGIIEPRKTALGTMSEKVDELAVLMIGKPLPETSAQVKVETAKKQITGELQEIYMKHSDFGPLDPNTAVLSNVLGKLSSKLDSTIDANNTMASKYDDLLKQYENSIKIHAEKEIELSGLVEQYHQEVNDVKLAYAKLETLLQQTTDQQVQTMKEERDALKKEKDNLDNELSKMRAELMLTRDMMRRAQAEIAKIKPAPDANTIAYQPDGKIILVDPQTKIVHINIGSDDGVYPGLTFEVYDKSLPIPKDGQGKAEIEIFDVQKTISSARIVTALNPRTPIIQDDTIANLIWEKNVQNTFVVFGDFTEADSEKIKNLIAKWGGKAEKEITVNTDYVVLGNPPKVLAKPTVEQQSIDPTAMEKYEASRQRSEKYKQILDQAKTLSIPIFNMPRFLNFIGYRELATQPGAFN